MRSIFDSIDFEVWKPALARGVPVFVPINPVEYHGPHLSLLTDALICQGFITDIYAALKKRHEDWVFLQTPELHIGASPAPGPGTQETPFPIVKKEVKKLCSALAELGAQKVILMTFHGSPLHGLALEAGLHLLRKRRILALSPFNVLAQLLLDYQPSQLMQIANPPLNALEREHVKLLDPLDYHAGCLETSLLLHYSPQQVRPLYSNLPPCPTPTKSSALIRFSKMMGNLPLGQLSKEFHFAAGALSWAAIRPYMGYTGKPHLASREAGATFARLIVQAFARTIEQVLSEQMLPPAPMLKWMPLMTLNGRLARLVVADEEVWRPAN